MKEKSERAVFATRFGAVATTVGSAVGLGNIWRFPYEAGVHGGGAFLILYFCFVMLIGVPLLCAEYSMGRGTRSNIFRAYRKLKPTQNWHLAGYIGIISSLLILSFYSVVAGWTVEYFLSSLTGQLVVNDTDMGHRIFLDQISGLRALIWTAIFLLINFGILISGVTKGIERASNILMPLFFLILIAFCINSFMLPGFGEGIDFLFKPDFAQITPSVMLGALGQAFFSLSLGLGCMMTYGSYFKDSNRLGRTAVTTAILDSMVAVLAGIIIFPAVFSFGLSPEAGPTLVFEVLPYIFSQLPGSRLWSSLFFLLLFLASLTSTVSMSEISITYFCEEKGWKRHKATVVASIIALIGGLLCALSFGPLSDFTVHGLTIFSLFDYLSSNIFLPVGGLICSVFVGWCVNKKFLREQMTNYGSFRYTPFGLLRFCLRWICPIGIFLIFLNSVGII